MLANPVESTKMRLTCRQLVVAMGEKKCYANSYFERSPWPVDSVNRLPGGAGEQNRGGSASSKFLSSLPRPAKHPAVVSAVLDGTCVSERMVSNEAYSGFFFLVTSTTYAYRTTLRRHSCKNL